MSRLLSRAAGGLQHGGLLRVAGEGERIVRVEPFTAEAAGGVGASPQAGVGPPRGLTQRAGQRPIAPAPPHCLAAHGPPHPFTHVRRAGLSGLSLDYTRTARRLPTAPHGHHAHTVVRPHLLLAASAYSIAVVLGNPQSACLGPCALLPWPSALTRHLGLHGTLRKKVPTTLRILPGASVHPPPSWVCSPSSPRAAGL